MPTKPIPPLHRAFTARLRAARLRLVAVVTAPAKAELRRIRARSRVGFAVGALVALLAALGAGELYLRLAPPGDLAPYLSEGAAPGPFRTDPEFGVQYRSLDALRADNPGALEPYLPLFNNPSAPPAWAFFGNSFVQAPGMLADTSRQFVPSRVMFNLGKNEPVPVRFAQAALLLDSGFKPERVFLVFIPLDVYSFAVHGLDQYRATEQGGLVYAPRTPPVGGGFVRNSRLALKGWTRTNLHQNRPFFASPELYTRVDETVRADVRTVLERFAGHLAKHRVPATVVLLPSYEQVLRGAGFAVQDALAADAREAGFDVCNVRATFLAWPDRHELFIPDKHFSATGNRLLLAALLEHLKATDPRAADLPSPAEVRP